MEPDNSRLFGEPQRDIREADTLKLQASNAPIKTGTIARDPFKIPDTPMLDNTREGKAIETLDTAEMPGVRKMGEQAPVEARETAKVPLVQGQHPVEEIATHKLPGIFPEMSDPLPPLDMQRRTIPRGRALAMVALLFILTINAANAGFAQFIGPQGWAFVLGGGGNSNNTNLLKDITKSLKNRHAPTPGATAQPTAQVTPQQFVNLLVQNMTLDQKLGQMMLVQFTGPDYSLDLNEMLSQYHVGSVLLFLANGNIVNKTQLKSLTQQIQKNAPNGIPMAISIDQEGGRVDRLIELDGPRPSATTIGASNDPNQARAAGMQAAQDLTSYGINLNLAPVVDVNNVFNQQLYHRTFGNTPSQVTRMAEAYLEGLQQSGKVLGTLKHFPGLGDVGEDPHLGIPYLTRSRSQLESIDWAPYRAMIAQGNVHAIMVTHEIVSAIDSGQISSLSYKCVTGVLRDDLGFQGVIMTDSLTMDGITARYTEEQATVMAVQAGADLLMGAISARTLATMIEALKQAVSLGQISQQRIDDSVRRILMLKYDMGLLTLPTS